jgi:type II secretory pathway component HofQ
MKSILFVISVVICFSLGVFGQMPEKANETKSFENPCKFGEEDFVGENIDLNVVNTDIREILTYVTEQFGCNFVLNDSVKKISTSVKLNQIPWNVALTAILNAYDLGSRTQKTIRSDSEVTVIYIGTKTEIQNYGKCIFPSEDALFANAALFSERIAIDANSPRNPNKFEFVTKMIQKRLSRRGTLTANKESQEITITDVRGNLDALIQLIQIIEHEFTLQEQNRAEIENKEEKP